MYGGNVDIKYTSVLFIYINNICINMNMLTTQIIQIFI